jgi:trehalose-6-phosphatase
MHRAADLIPLAARLNGARMVSRSRRLDLDGFLAPLASRNLTEAGHRATELAGVCLEIMSEVAHRTLGVEILRGKVFFEIKPAGISQGTASGDFMAGASFAGRLPLLAGGDETCETGFSAGQLPAGQGIKVGESAALVLYRSPSPATLWQWLKASRGGSSAGLLPK